MLRRYREWSLMRSCVDWGASESRWVTLRNEVLACVVQRTSHSVTLTVTSDAGVAYARVFRTTERAARALRIMEREANILFDGYKGYEQWESKKSTVELSSLILLSGRKSETSLLERF